MILPDRKGELRRILLENSVSFGDFTLSSGEKSRLYIDARKTTLHSAGVVLVATIFLEELIKDPSVNVVGGPTLGADPIVGAMLSLSQNRDIRGFIVRKEKKGHGAQNLIEGNLHSGDRAVIVEDVLTTGASVLRAVDALRAAGAEISKVMAIVNRGCPDEVFSKRGIELFSIFRVEELVN